MTDKTANEHFKGAVAKLDAIEKTRTTHDAYYNATTGLGTSTYDRHKGTQQVRTMQLADQELETYYIENDIAATVVDRPVDEALRQGYELTWPGGDPQEKADLVTWAEDTYQVSAHVSRARKWARLFGGAGVFIGADDGQELTEPREPGVPVDFLRTYARPDLQAVLWYNEKADLGTSLFGKPSVYRTNTATSGNVNITDIHESRFQLFQGLQTTGARYLERNGWGDSVLNRVLEVLKRFDGSWLSTMELLQDSSVGIYYVKQLFALLESGNADALAERLRIINQQKNNLRPIVMDADGERFERVSPQLAEVANILMNAMIRVSAAAQMPVSILFGQAPAGLNATPEGDLRNWYDRVSAERRENLAPAIVQIYRTLLSQPDSPTNGKIPEGLSVRFPSLWQTDPIQQATLYQMRATADAVYLNGQVVDTDELAIARAATNDPFGFPDINVEARKERLESLQTPAADVVQAPDLSAAPASDQPDTGAPSGLSVTDEPQKAALNGAQIKSLQDLALAVADGLLPKPAAIEIVLASFPVSEATARSIFESIPDSFAEKKANPPPAPVPPGMAPPAPAAPTPAADPDGDPEDPDTAAE